MPSDDLAEWMKGESLSLVAAGGSGRADLSIFSSNCCIDGVVVAIHPMIRSINQLPHGSGTSTTG